MKTKIYILGIFAFVTLVVAAPRTWILKTGETVTGDYVSSGTTTLVVKTHGTNHFVELSDLSTNDQAYVAEQKAVYARLVKQEAIAKFQNEFDLAYDKFHDNYEYTSKKKMSSPGDIFKISMFAYVRDKNERPDYVTVHFVSDSPGIWLFRPTTDVIFLYDGNRKAFSDVDVDQDVISADDLLEQITVDFSFDEFKKVAFSQSVEAKLGVLSPFIFDYQSRYTWRDFADHFQDFTNSTSNAILSLKSTNKEPSATGTGFFITGDGYLISNYHVVKDATRVRLLTGLRRDEVATATQAGAGLIDAKVVQVDAANDLALLKADGRFACLPIAASRTVALGGTVATVGFPDIGLQGFAPKLAKGEIASLSGAGDDPRYFQISVPVQPGNSGGALVDERGNVIGIVSAKLDASTALAMSGSLPENVNYAVKSSLLLSFLESVPSVSAKLKAPNTADEKFEEVVKSAQDAAVLVLVY